MAKIDEVTFGSIMVERELEELSQGQSEIIVIGTGTDDIDRVAQ